MVLHGVPLTMEERFIRMSNSSLPLVTASGAPDSMINYVAIILQGMVQANCVGIVIAQLSNVMFPLDSRTQTYGNQVALHPTQITQNLNEKNILKEYHTILLRMLTLH